MRQDDNHRLVFAGQESLGEDFSLIAQAIADAFRGLASASRLETRWSTLRHSDGGC